MRTVEDLKCDIRAQFPYHYVQFCQMTDQAGESLKVAVDGLLVRLRLDPFRLTPEFLEQKCMGLSNYDELLAQISYEIEKFLAHRLAERRKQIERLYMQELEEISILP